jgi:hypothetical protein
MQPRIYVYKTTFEEIPDWYWGVHKEEKYGEPYLGSPKTHAWKWNFYTPHLQICEIFPYTDEGWTQARRVEDSCIKPDLNNPLCLNEHYGGLMSLEACRRGAKKLMEIIHAEKDEDGKSLHTLKLHADKDGNGKSLHALKTIVKAHEDKDELGRSRNGVKAAERTNEAKDEKGRSVNAVKGAEKANEINHEEKTEEGKSKHAVKMGKAAHRDKNEEGKSKHAVKIAEKLNGEKDTEGKSLNASRGGKTAASQIWQSTIDGFVSNASNVAQHNKARGWDPNARVKIGVKL